MDYNPKNSICSSERLFYHCHDASGRKVSLGGVVENNIINPALEWVICDLQSCKALFNTVPSFWKHKRCDSCFQRAAKAFSVDHLVSPEFKASKTFMQHTTTLKHCFYEPDHSRNILKVFVLCYYEKQDEWWSRPWAALPDTKTYLCVRCVFMEMPPVLNATQDCPEPSERTVTRCGTTSRPQVGTVWGSCP